MRSNRSVLAVVAVVAVAAVASCGDNSRECGQGTKLDDTGFCVVDMPACGVGTVLDPGTNTCVVDGAICHDGTVYLAGKGCVDPTTILTVDLSEGVEPNGLGVVEASDTPAGMIVLKPQDHAFVIKGTIEPFRDDDGDGEIDPDLDSYVVAVTAPTLVEVTVYGTNGLAAAFIALADPANPAAGWRRFGVNVSGEIAKRQLYFPAAGVYTIAVGDLRSLLVDGDAPPVAGSGGAAGGPTAAYYVTITVKPTPAPIALEITNNTAASTGPLALGEVKMFSAAMGLGTNEIRLEVAGTPTAAVTVSNTAGFRAQANEGRSDAGASLQLGGFAAGDTALIAADTTYDYGPQPATYRLSVRLDVTVASPRPLP